MTNLLSWTRWGVVALLLGIVTYGVAEEFTLSTYYPSPRGVYHELRTAGPIKVGDVSSAAAQARLEVRGAGADFTTAGLLVTNNSSTPLLVVRDSGLVGIGVNDPAATGRLVVMGGNAGIGTINPAVPLHVTAASAAGNSAQEIVRLTHVDADGAGAAGIGARLSYTLETTAADTLAEAARIEAVLEDATNSSKDASLRFFVLGPNAAAGTNAPTEQMRIDSAGAVGIGTTAPTAGAKLDVAGKIWLSSSDSLQRTMTNVAQPTNPTDVATKEYVDAAAGGGGGSFVNMAGNGCPAGWTPAYTGTLKFAYAFFSNCGSAGGAGVAEMQCTGNSISVSNSGCSTKSVADTGQTCTVCVK